MPSIGVAFETKSMGISFGAKVIVCVSNDWDGPIECGCFFRCSSTSIFLSFVYFYYGIRSLDLIFRIEIHLVRNKQQAIADWILIIWWYLIDIRKQTTEDEMWEIHRLNGHHQGRFECNLFEMHILCRPFSVQRTEIGEKPSSEAQMQQNHLIQITFRIHMARGQRKESSAHKVHCALWAEEKRQKKNRCSLLDHIRVTRMINVDFYRIQQVRVINIPN